MQGLTDEDIEKMEKDPLQAPLDDKDRAMVAFVIKAITTQMPLKNKMLISYMIWGGRTAISWMPWHTLPICSHPVF